MREDVLAVLDVEEDLGPADREVFARASVQRVMREGIAESVRNGPAGWFDDDLAFLRYPWGFDLTAIRVPVLLTYGEDDSLAPKAHGEYLAGVIPGVEVRIMPGGHLSPIVHAEENWARVLALGSTPRQG